MKESVYEPAREIPVLAEVDVLVVGGGVAGCAAAYAAGKAGARTMLLERNGCLGGVATATLMANIGNVYLNATGKQVLNGFAGEVIDRLIAAGAASPKWASRDVPGCVIDSERLKITLIEMLEEAGVTILTHALGARPIPEGSTVRGAFMESKSGRQAVFSAVTIDATGEADMAWQAGAEVSFSGGTTSTLFKLGNVDLDAFVDFLARDPEGFPDRRDFVKDLDTFQRNWRERGILFFPHGGGRHWKFMQEAVARNDFSPQIDCARNLDALGMYALQGNGCVVINSNFYKVTDLDVRNLSRFELHAQKMCYYVADFLAKHVPGFRKAYVAHVGVDSGIRTSRRILGPFALKREVTTESTAPVHYDDVVGVLPVWDHRLTGGEFVKEITYDIPFAITVPQGCENLLVASGKSVSTEPIGVLRSMGGCMICGQATGVAAALGARSQTDPAKVGTRAMQKELVRQGVYLGPEERLRELGLAG